MNNFQYKLFKLECGIKRILRLAIKGKDKTPKVYAFIIPSIHKHKNEIYDDVTIVETEIQMHRIKRMCKEKDCYCEYQQISKSTINCLKGYIDYFETIERLNNLKER